jgi:drug/metabolite transporter (DMT)-like permease
LNANAERTAQPLGTRSAILGLLVGVVRGGNQVALKIALTALPPLWTAFGRMSISCLTVGLWSRSQGYDLMPTRDEIPKLALLGAMFTFQISILHIGADYTSPAYSVILVNVNPIMANLIAHFFVPEDRLSPLRLLGLLIAFAGVTWVFFGKPDPGLAPNPTLGNTLMVISASMVAARTVYIQRLVQNMLPEKAVFCQMLLALPVFLVGGAFFAGVGERGPLGWQQIAAMTYQGLLVGGVGLLTWIYLLRKHTPGTVSVFSFVTPFCGVFVSAIVFGEEITPRLLSGVAAVLTGIYLVTRSGRVLPVSEPRS